eukprot:9717188-Alexandrium_andersonii.AAC.1
MSASLVGSEMCIRDSLRTVPRRPAICTLGVEEGAPRMPTICGSHEAEEAVSYTHLTLPTICSV